MLYQPRQFRVEDPKLVAELVQRHNFATLVSIVDGAPIISHLPFFFEANGGSCGVLHAHMARANPQWRSFRSDAPVVAIFNGPHAYISPRWYEPQPDNVPTWNYAVVHMHGLARVIENQARVHEVMHRLVDQHDPEWVLSFQSHDVRQLLNEIVVFEIEVTKVDAKFKLSQNRSPQDRASVVAEFAKSSVESDREIARLMATVMP